MAAKDNLIDRLVKVRITRDQASSPGNTTLATAAAATDTSIEVADDSNFADGQAIRIGSGDTLEFNWIDGTPSSDTLPLGRPLLNAHASGTAVVEQVSYDMGPPLAEGATWSFAGTSVDIPVATQRLPIASIPGFVTRTLAWPLPSFTPHLFAFATGMPLSKVVGSGTSAAPTVLTTDGSEFGSVANQTYIAEAVTVDGGGIAVEYWGASTDLQNFSLAFSRGQQTPLPFGASAANTLFETAGYAAMADDATYAANAAKVWRALSAFGVFVDTGTTTTLNGALSAGATALVMTSGASFSNDDWIKISGANGVEYTQLKDKSTNNFNLKVPTQRAIGTGVTITKVTLAPFAAVAPAGVSFGVSVQTNDINSAIHPSAIHRRIGNVTITLSGGITDITLANLALALGIPSSDIVSATRMLADDNVGSQGIDGVYFTGTTMDGSTTMLIAAGTQVDLANIASTWTNQGEAAAIPFTVKPTSVVALLQYT